MNQAIGTLRVLARQDQEEKQSRECIVCGPRFSGFDVVSFIAAAVYSWPTMKVSHENSDF